MAGKSPTHAPLCGDKPVSCVWPRKKAREYSSYRGVAGGFLLGTPPLSSLCTWETTCMTASLLQRQVKMHQSLIQLSYPWFFLRTLQQLPMALKLKGKTFTKYVSLVLLTLPEASPTPCLCSIWSSCNSLCFLMTPSTTGPWHMLFLLSGTLTLPLVPMHFSYLNTEKLSPNPRLDQLSHCTTVLHGAYHTL